MNADTDKLELLVKISMCLLMAREARNAGDSKVEAVQNREAMKARIQLAKIVLNETEH